MRLGVLAASISVCALIGAACADGEDEQSSGDPILTTTSVSGIDAAGTFAKDHRSPLYEDDAAWLCRPGLAMNPCEENLDVTVVTADGDSEVVSHEPASNPAFDCFYVYPTVRLGSEGNATFDGDYAEERNVVRGQAAPFSSLCRVFAPVYRQSTAASEDPESPDIAYADVVDAFAHFLANDSDGRPFMLIGHSQGAAHLLRLLAEEVDVDEALSDRLVSAFLVGGTRVNGSFGDHTTVLVAKGSDVGGSFEQIRACRSADQIGCVISYSSFDSTEPPDDAALFGFTDQDGLEVLCTNPADLTGSSGPLDTYLGTEPSLFFSEPYTPWADGVTDKAPITTPFVAMPDLATATCVNDGRSQYLELTFISDAGPRVDELPQSPLPPSWGTHVFDMSVALGDLIEIAAAQGDSWSDTHGQ